MTEKFTKLENDIFTIGGHNYRLVVLSPVPFQKHISDTKDVMAGMVRMERREIYFSSCLSSRRGFRFMLFSVESTKDIFTSLLGDSTPENEPSLLSLQQESNLTDVLRGLHERAARAGVLLKGTAIEIPTNEEEPDDDYAYLELATGGLPPVALVGGSGFTFPIRSGLPCGVLPEWFTRLQSLDWSAGDVLNFYTEVKHGGVRAFHNSLREGQAMECLPNEMVLIQLQFIS